LPNYDFRTLSPIDFEILVRDLLQEELGIRLENFKSGSDSGIDLRYCPNKDSTLIVQCKHYAESSFAQLRRVIKAEELEKVKELNPERYIVATSLGLTPNNKDEIIEICDSYIKGTADILGRDDLNGLLSKYPKIERHTFKLWLSSMAVFEEILHSKIKNISHAALEKICLHAKYYVQNKSFQEALTILDKHHFCIIAGIPGIGKTMLAEMLCLYFIDQGYEMIKVSSDISEAWAIDPTKQKRIYFYDDFLGQTSLTDKLNKNEDQKLLDFIYTTRESKVSKLILTTREYILNQVRLIYEKIARERFDGETCVVDLSKYTRMNRAKILFNHIYFSKLPYEYKEALLHEKNYLKIIDHKNYNPRIIDLMTQFTRIEHIRAENYIKSFSTNLDNPMTIWKHTFEEQLSVAARNLLIVLLTLPTEVFLEDLQEAFQSFHMQQAKRYNYSISSQDFMHALKALEGNFIVSERSRDKILIRFHNPSLRDFLENYLSEDELIVTDLIQSSVFFDQALFLWECNKEDSEASCFKGMILKHAEYFVSLLRRVLSSKTCRLINYTSENLRYKDRWSISFESRVVLVAEVAAASGNHTATKLLEELIGSLEKLFDNNSAKPEDLSKLLKRLKELKLIDSEIHISLLEKAKRYLMGHLDWWDEFKAFCDFENLFRELVTDEDKKFVIKEFEGVAHSDWDYLSDAPDNYRDDAHQIRSISKKLGIDMSERVKELEDKADEMEASGEYATDEHDYEYWGSQSGDYCSDQEIDSIFNTLLE